MWVHIILYMHLSLLLMQRSDGHVRISEEVGNDDPADGNNTGWRKRCTTLSESYSDNKGPDSWFTVSEAKVWADVPDLSAYNDDSFRKATRTSNGGQSTADDIVIYRKRGLNVNDNHLLRHIIPVAYHSRGIYPWYPDTPGFLREWLTNSTIQTRQHIVWHGIRRTFYV